MLYELYFMDWQESLVGEYETLEECFEVIASDGGLTGWEDEGCWEVFHDEETIWTEERNEDIDRYLEWEATR